MENTKWEILEDRMVQAQALADSIKAQLAGMADTECGLSCSCGKVLDTEADFAQHFVIARINVMNNHLNLGECPFSAKGEAIIANR